MAAEFNASGEFTPEQCAEVAALDPYNPFYTLAYARAREAVDSKSWLLSVREDGRIAVGCLGFLKTGRLNRSLEIPSLPCATAADVFWKGLLGFCRQQRVSELVAHSFASSNVAIPKIPGETGRRTRVEYVLDLASPGLWSGMSSNHKRNAQKAQKAGILIERSTAIEHCQEHARLQDASMERRMVRGEQVKADAQVRTFIALIEQQAGEFFRATQEGKVLSSFLILRAERGGYYHSAGTSSEGMAKGASHLLIRQVAEILRGEGMERFNLGSAGADNPGLERFKTGFGSRAVQSEAAQFYFGSRLQRGLGAAVNMMRQFAKERALKKEKLVESEEGHTGPS
jgi:hypothetical protein